jgi:DNA-binding transcriptional LysR family regulator
MTKISPKTGQAAPWHAETRLRIRHLVLIDELVRTGNMRLAAERMNMSQPAATKLLQDAEDALGERLFERSRQGVSPTMVGNVMAFRARQMLSDLGSAREDIRMVAQGRSGRLRIGAFLVASPTLLPRAIDLFLNVFPHAAINIEEAAQDKLIPALLEGAIDLIVGRIVEEDPSPGLKRESLYLEEACIVCGPDHPLAGKTRLTIGSLAGFAWALPGFTTPLRRRLNDLMINSGFPPPEIFLESASLLTNIAMLRVRPILAILPESVAMHFQKRKEVKVLHVAAFQIMIPVGIVSREARKHSPMVEEFVRCLKEAATELREKRGGKWSLLPIRACVIPARSGDTRGRGTLA